MCVPNWDLLFGQDVPERQMRFLFYVWVKFLSIFIHYFQSFRNLFKSVIANHLFLFRSLFIVAKDPMWISDSFIIFVSSPTFFDKMRVKSPNSSSVVLQFPQGNIQSSRSLNFKLLKSGNLTYEVIKQAENFRCPSLTALQTAVLSAQVVLP